MDLGGAVGRDPKRFRPGVIYPRVGETLGRSFTSRNTFGWLVLIDNEPQQFRGRPLHLLALLVPFPPST